MSIRDEARAEAERVMQSNDIAHTIIEVAQDKEPGLFITLGLRYGIADALWGAGYRKVDPEPSDEWCREEGCQYRYWRSGSMPTHRRGAGCPDQFLPNREPSDADLTHDEFTALSWALRLVESKHGYSALSTRDGVSVEFEPLQRKLRAAQEVRRG